MFMSHYATEVCKCPKHSIISDTNNLQYSSDNYTKIMGGGKKNLESSELRK
jgi:hypothetical protein